MRLFLPTTTSHLRRDWLTVDVNESLSIIGEHRPSIKPARLTDTGDEIMDLAEWFWYGYVMHEISIHGVKRGLRRIWALGVFIMYWLRKMPSPLRAETVSWVMGRSDVMGVVVMLQSDIKPQSPVHITARDILIPKTQYSWLLATSTRMTKHSTTAYPSLPSALSPSFDNLASLPPPSHHSLPDKLFGDRVV